MKPDPISSYSSNILSRLPTVQITFANSATGLKPAGIVRLDVLRRRTRKSALRNLMRLSQDQAADPQPPHQNSNLFWYLVALSGV
jgi:hypothetical protein